MYEWFTLFYLELYKRLSCSGLFLRWLVDRSFQMLLCNKESVLFDTISSDSSDRTCNIPDLDVFGWNVDNNADLLVWKLVSNQYCT